MGFISSWVQGIIVSVIIATIIEMILPNSNNSKYVKVVIGVFILFTIVSPIINKFISNSGNKVNFDADLETSANETITASAGLNNKDTIRKMYEENLKIDIKTKISQKGYTVGDINLEILNNDEYTLNKIDLKISAKKQGNNNENNTKNATTIVQNIQNIKVSIGGSSKDEEKEQSVINETDRRKIKDYLSSVYEVNENNILVN